MIRMPLMELDALWLAVQPIDMRAGSDRLLASVVRVQLDQGQPDHLSHTRTQAAHSALHCTGQ